MERDRDFKTALKKQILPGFENRAFCAKFSKKMVFSEILLLCRGAGPNFVVGGVASTTEDKDSSCMRQRSRFLLGSLVLSTRFFNQNIFCSERFPPAAQTATVANKLVAFLATPL